MQAAEQTAHELQNEIKRVREEAGDSALKADEASQLQDELQQQREFASKLELAHSREADELRSTLEELRKQLQTSQNLRTELETSLQTANSELSSTEDTMGQLQSAKKRLEEQSKDWAVERQQLEQQLGSKQQEFELEKEAWSIQQKQIEQSLTDQARQLEAEFSKLLAERASQTAEVSAPVENDLEEIIAEDANSSVLDSMTAQLMDEIDEQVADGNATDQDVFEGNAADGLVDDEEFDGEDAGVPDVDAHVPGFEDSESSLDPLENLSDDVEDLLDDSFDDSSDSISSGLLEHEEDGNFDRRESDYELNDEVAVDVKDEAEPFIDETFEASADVEDDDAIEDVNDDSGQSFTVDEDATGKLELKSSDTVSTEEEPGQKGVRDTDDESIESYMAQLMQRVGGDAEDLFADESSTDTVVDDPNEGGRPDMTFSAPDPAPQKPRYRRRQVPNELENLTAMRDVANASARSALDRHSKTHWTHDAALKLTMAVGSVMVGATLLYFGRNQGAYVFSAAMVSFVVGALWAMQAWKMRLVVATDTKKPNVANADAAENSAV